MGIVIRQSIIGSVIAYTGVVLGTVNRLFIFPAFLALDQIGLYQAIISMATILSPFATWGLSTITLKFLPRYFEDQETKSAFFQFILALLIPSFILFTIFFKLFEVPLFGFFEQKSPELVQFDFLILALIYINAITSVFDSFTRIHLNIVVTNIAREVVIKFMAGFLVLLYFLEIISFDTLLNGLIINYSLAFLILLSYSLKKKYFKVNFRWGGVPKDFWSNMVPYGLTSMLSASSALIVSNVDILMVSALLGLTDNGIYSTVMNMAIVIDIPRRIISQIAAPLISKSFEKNDLNEVSKIYSKTSLTLLIGGMLFFIGIVSNLHNIFSILPNGSSLSAGYYVVVILGLAKLLDMGAGVNGEIVVLSKYYTFNLITIMILAAGTIGFNLIFIPQFGMEGAAFATLLSLIFFNLSKFIFLWIKFGMQPFNIQTIKVLVAGTLVYFGISLIPQISYVMVDLIIRSLLITTLFIGLVYFLKVSDDVNGIIQNLIARIKNNF